MGYPVLSTDDQWLGDHTATVLGELDRMLTSSQLRPYLSAIEPISLKKIKTSNIHLSSVEKDRVTKLIQDADRMGRILYKVIQEPREKDEQGRYMLKLMMLEYQVQTLKTLMSEG